MKCFIHNGFRAVKSPKSDNGWDIYLGDVWRGWVAGSKKDAKDHINGLERELPKR